MSVRLLASDLGRMLVIPANSTRRVPVRGKGGVIPHKKPRWIPPAKSKMFTLKRVDHTPQSEVEQLNTLKHNYKAHFNAVTQYLYEDYLRNSDTGERAVIEAKREADALDKLIAENEGENETVAARRKERLKNDVVERRKQIESDLEEKARLEEVRQRQIAEVVASETESMENRIRPEDIGRAVEEALAKPVDYEYAIDTDGHMYRGRYTRPTSEAAEKIPQLSEGKSAFESVESISSRYWQ